jgi:hypothetical protein
VRDRILDHTLTGDEVLTRGDLAGYGRELVGELDVLTHALEKDEHKNVQRQ